MPSPLEIIFNRNRKPKAISINRGPYVMEMADGENAEITMYGEIVERQPKHWWTGERWMVILLCRMNFCATWKTCPGPRR